MQVFVSNNPLDFVMIVVPITRTVITLLLAGAAMLGFGKSTFAQAAEPTPPVSNQESLNSQLSTLNSSQGEEPLASVSERFAEATSETPGFQKHVIPLLGRLGCNGRACHGSFKGQGGFQLSLFGYDFKSDHEQITNEDYSRIVSELPELSMLLDKPTLGQEHGGGKRMEVDSWQYRLLYRWIEAGAPVRKKSLELRELTVFPKQLVFQSADEQRSLRVIAHWSDGTREDVTALCRFQSNNPAVAEINDAGVVTSGEPGDTHVVVFYDSGVAPVPVLRPVSKANGARYLEIAARTRIDELVVEKLRTLGIVPSEVTDDATFLRRVSLDLTGTLPAADDVESFLADTSADKRSRKIEELLDSPAYATWWATRLSDWTGNNPDFANLEIGRNQVAEDWYEWIEKRVANNTPYDEIVAGFVLSQSRESGESFLEYCENMRNIYSKNGTEEFADRQTMPHYWARRNFRKAEDRAIGFAYSFMGVRIQCAQCHKHPFDQWTQDDFKKFTAFFTRVQYGTNRESRDKYQDMIAEFGDGKRGAQLRRQLGDMLRDGKVVPLQEVYVTPPARGGKRGKQARGNRNRPAATGRLLGGETINLNKQDDPRVPLMKWLRSPENPYFAKAFVNRVWANYFNVGIVDPVDDLSLANPPSNAALLNYLAKGFIDSGYDMKWLHREIVLSDTYQRSWVPNETNRGDVANFSHAVPRRLPAEVAYDAVNFALVSTGVAREMRADPSLRAIGIPGAGTRYRERIGRTDASFALEVFGRSTRESNCACDRSTESSLLQTVYLRNDSDVLDMIVGGRGTWMGDVRQALGEPAAARSKRGNKEGGEAAERIRKFEKRIKTGTKQVARFRKAGKTEQARKLTQRLTQARERLREAKRRAEQRGKKGGPGNAAADGGGGPVAMLPDDPAKLVEQAYLRTLSRYPRPEEIQTAMAYLESADDLSTGVGDLLWALVNTKEFVVNH